jgi:predicted amidohydrolase
VRAALVVHEGGVPAEESLATMVREAHEAAGNAAALAVFPEAAVTGLVNNDDPAHDLALGDTVAGRATEALSAAAEAEGCHIAFGLLEREGRRLYDSAVLVGPDGHIALHYRRIQPQWHGRKADPEVYCQGSRTAAAATALGAVAFLVCGDLFDDTIVGRVASLTPDYVLVPFARNFSNGSLDQEPWDREEEPAYVERARMTGATVLMVNSLERAGLSEWPSFGGALAVARSGEVLARFPLGQRGTLYVEV